MTGPEPVKCATHPDVTTNLRCGKCGKPICPKCMVVTPVGARCRDCARLYKLPTFRVSVQYYLRAAATALALAVVLGLLWGFIENLLPFHIFSLIAAMGIGWVIGELVSRSVNRKKSSGLAVIGGAGVAISYGIAYLVEYLRAGFISFDLYRVVFTLVALGIGIYFAASRLR
jgi:membrane protein CcdC involved in cytochrome C biogenesis